MTTSILYQTIDQLSREKAIDAQIIISAVEDAILVSTRKYYKSVEDLQAHFNKESGIVEVGLEILHGFVVLPCGHQDGIFDRRDDNLGVDALLPAQLVDCLIENARCHSCLKWRPTKLTPCPYFSSSKINLAFEIFESSSSIRRPSPKSSLTLPASSPARRPSITRCSPTGSFNTSRARRPEKCW